VIKKKNTGRQARSKTSSDSDSNKPKKDEALEGLMSEIETEVRHERLLRLWDRYSVFLVGGALAVIALVAGFQFYETKDRDQRLLYTRNYQIASNLLAEGDLEGALEKFSDLGVNSKDGYAVLAQFNEAAIYVEKGELDRALGLYRMLSNDTGADPLLRDLATIVWALHGIGYESPEELEDALRPLTSPNNPFNHSAIELSALLAHQRGENDRAQRLLEELLADPLTPSGMRQRAIELAAVFNGGSKGTGQANGGNTRNNVGTSIPAHDFPTADDM